MHAHLDGIVLSWKSERIPSHRMHDIVSLLQLISAPYVRDYISSPMSYMKAISRRIRKHVQTVVLFPLIPLFVSLKVDWILLPSFTPFFLDCLMVIRYV